MEQLSNILQPVKYSIGNPDDPNEPNRNYIEYCGRTGWAVRNTFRCMSINGDWVFEPLPSSRTDEFLKEHRFSSPELALETYIKNIP